MVAAPPRLAPGAARVALPPLVAAVPATLVAPPVGAALVALAAAVVWFYRDPERTPPAVGTATAGRDGAADCDAGAAGVDPAAAADPAVVLAPCDGHVSVVREADGRLLVGTFMSPLDVHVVRAPVAGRVGDVEHVPGGHWPAFSKASERNERLHLDLRDAGGGGEPGPESEFESEGRDSGAGTGTGTGDGNASDRGPPVRTTLIAGALARRITAYVGGGERLDAGDRVGHIAFGSRTDVLLPPGVDRADLRVSRGDRVRAGETVLARIDGAGGAAADGGARGGAGAGDASLDGRDGA